MKKYILTESQYNKLMDKLLSEQPEHYNYNMAIQCFLNKKGIKDDSGQPVKMDGSIGRYPNSKSAQAIMNYQHTLKMDPKQHVNRSMVTFLIRECTFLVLMTNNL